MDGHPLDQVLSEAGARFAEADGLRTVADYGDPAGEYAAAATGVGLCDLRHRGLIEVVGADRAAWLHNLTTNTVRDLRPGDGNYAFATNAKGRILFDLNVLIRADRIWLDVDRRLVGRAMEHLERYIITEDVQLCDRSDAFVRLGLPGPRSAEVAAKLGVPQVAAMPSLGSASLAAGLQDRLLVRHDFAGVFGIELYVERAAATEVWAQLLEAGRPAGIRPVGEEVLEVLRIEAGIPICGKDIDETTLPAETGQLDRAVSFVKGCYLGQEVVERMRSRAAVARRLVGLRFDADSRPEEGAILRVGGDATGRVTSQCHSYALGATIGLGYVRSAHANPGTAVRAGDDPPLGAQVVALPFRATASPGL